MQCVKCGHEIVDGAAFCPFCGEKVAQSTPGPEEPLYQAEVKRPLKPTGRLMVYRDRTEFVTSSVQKAIFNYAGLVSVKKGMLDNIEFLTEDGRTEVCPADRKCVHEALVHIEQAARAYMDQRKERLLSQGVRYSFASSQGLMSSGVLNLSDRQAEFVAKSGKNEVVPYEEVKAVSASGGTLNFTLFGGGSKSFAVGKEMQDEVLAFVRDAVAPYLVQRREALLAQGIYFSSEGPDGSVLNVLADRAESRSRAGAVEGCVYFRDIRAVNAYGSTLELGLVNGTAKTFPVEEELAAGILAHIKAAIEPYVAARTVGFDRAFGVDERIEFNEERGVFHLIRQGGREITEEWPMEGLLRCAWTEDKKLTALGSVVSGGIELFKSATKAAGSQAAETEEKFGSLSAALTVRTGEGTQDQAVCFGRSSVGISRSDKKFGQCLAEWEALAEYLRDHCPACELVEPVIPEPEPLPPEGEELPEGPEPEETGGEAPAGEEASAAPEAVVRRDDLGIAKYIEGVSRFIETCETPMTIALQGNRGSGRNSILGRLYDRMEESFGKNLFWLSARQIARGTSVEAMSALGGKALIDLLSGDGAGAKQAGNSFLTGLAGLATGIIAGDTEIGKEIAGGVLNKNASNGQEDGLSAFSRQVEGRLRGEEGKVVFFLEGLDQLTPARAVDLLEALRDFFACRGCVFVVSANYNSILAGARERYDENKAQHFFDRVFQMTFRVPASSINIKSYVAGKLEAMGVRPGDEEEPELCAGLVLSSVGRDLEAIDRLFVSFQLLRDMTGEEIFEDRYKRLLLFALLCMQTRFRGAYDHAMRHRDNITPQLLASLCGEPAQPWDADRTEEEAEAYRDFGAVFARIVNLDEKAEISQAECQAFAAVLELSSVTSR